MTYDALKLEDERLNKLLINYAGQHLVQLSSPTLSSLVVSPILHKFHISNRPQPPISSTLHSSFLQSAYTDLPFASDSIDLILLPHTLEQEKNAKIILNEVWRALVPNGHVIILGINPTSLWGLYRLFSSSKKPPWNGHFYASQTLCQWIHQLGGKICRSESFAFRPPLTSTLGRWLFPRMVCLEKIAPWLFPYLGGIYLIIAQKQVRRLKQLGPIWQFPPVFNDKTLANARRTHCV